MADESDAGSWIEVSAVVVSAAGDDLEAALEQAGALSVSVEAGGGQELFEIDPGTLTRWDRVTVTGLFDGGRDPLEIYRGLGVLAPDFDLGLLRSRRVADRDWERAWLENFRPVRIGERLWISPRGGRTAAGGEVVVYIDPGLAFGTGSHSSTRLCLSQLEADPPTGFEVLDFGCGSGILGIAALKLGAARVTGVDVDPRALAVSIDNARFNTVDDRYDCLLDTDFQPRANCDLVMANILAQTLQSLSATLTACLKPGGRLVLAGILEHQATAVESVYAGFTNWRRQDAAGWTMLVAERCS